MMSSLDTDRPNPVGSPEVKFMEKFLAGGNALGSTANLPFPPGGGRRNPRQQVAQRCRPFLGVGKPRVTQPCVNSAFPPPGPGASLFQDPTLGPRPSATTLPVPPLGFLLQHRCSRQWLLGNCRSSRLSRGASGGLWPGFPVTAPGARYTLPD